MAGRIADIDRARAAVERKAWSEAFELLDDLRAVGLAPEDLERLADAAWWTGRMEESIAARQKAYTDTRRRATIARPGGWPLASA